MFETRKFGAFIARKRKQADMTQSELAEKINLTRQSISKYETGECFPDISIVIKIAEVFNLTLDELINSGSPTAGESKILKNTAETVNIEDIVNVAPLVKPSVLEKYTDRTSMENIDILHAAELVQYLSDDNILKMLRSAVYNSLDEEMLGKMVPFLNDMAKEVILKKIIEGECDWRLIGVVMPYIREYIPQLEAAHIDGALPKEAMAMMNNISDTSKEAVLGKIIDGEADWRLLKFVMPYIDEYTCQLEAAYIDGALPKEAMTIVNEYWVKKLGLRVS